MSRRKARGSGGVSSAENGLTLTGSIVELGGPLLQDTYITLDNDNTKRVIFDSVLGQNDGTVSIFNAVNNPITSPSLGEDIISGIYIDNINQATGMYIGSDNNGSSIIDCTGYLVIRSLSQIEIHSAQEAILHGDSGIRITTPAVISASVTAGQVLTFQSNNQVEYQNINTIIKNGRVPVTTLSSSTTISNTAVTATNTILVTFESSVGLVSYLITGRTPGASFTVSHGSAPTGSFINYIIL